jgi:predicted RNA-binding Zn-ribbon protein involved in translation (DUF1610 family)
MEEGKKKTIMVAVIMACLVVAGIITYATRSGNSAGVDSLKAGATTWMKCRNPKCENEWQMNTKDFFDYVEKHHKVGSMAVTPVACPKCGEESGYRAEKCGKCGLVFEQGSVPNDFPDRCPKCGFSKIAESTKEGGDKEE